MRAVMYRVENVESKVNCDAVAIVKSNVNTENCSPSKENSDSQKVVFNFNFIVSGECHK